MSDSELGVATVFPFSRQRKEESQMEYRYQYRHSYRGGWGSVGVGEGDEALKGHPWQCCGAGRSRHFSAGAG